MQDRVSNMKIFLEEELIGLARKSISDRNSNENISSISESVEIAPTSVKTESFHLQVEIELVAILSSILKLPKSKIDVTDNVANYGADSLAITEFVKQVSELYTIDLQATIFFEARNLEGLAEIIASRYSVEVGEKHRVQSNQPEPSEQRETLIESPAIEVKKEASPVFSKSVKEQELLEKYQRAFRSGSNENSQAARSQTFNEQTKKEEVDYEPIAIIGVDGMFAKSSSPEELWRNVRNEVDCIEEIPANRWDWKSVHGNPVKENKTNVKWGGFIPEIDKFDAQFFNISPKEAEIMDPQHRLFMQSVWNTISRSGYSPKSLSGKKIGLFLGINLQDYQLKVQKLPIDAMNLAASAHVFCTSRISFLLNINGPCHIVDTACSSSLVAIHRAALAIQNEGCEMALAGGANLMMDPTMHIQYAKTGMICEDGKCKTFSNEANGYVRGEGVGAILLKKLSAAERDGDTILGVIRGSAENHGGTAASLTAPNPIAQSNLIKQAVAVSGVDPRDIGYIECHGTGTSLGDPIEINGIKGAFKSLFEDKNITSCSNNYCKIGSIKSNIGHAETAAGMAGLIKVLYAMKHSFIPKSLHSEQVNPLIDLKNTPFSIAQNGSEWTTENQKPKLAGISSFGAGGANAHIVVEEYIRKTQKDTRSVESIIPLSSKSKVGLRKNVEKLFSFLSVSDQVESSEIISELRNEVAQYLSKQLKLDPLDIIYDCPFQDMNIGRFEMTSLNQYLSETWNVNLPTSLFIDANTVSELVQNLVAFDNYEALVAYYETSDSTKDSISILRGETSIVETAYTLQTGRDEYAFRVAFVAKSIEELKSQLNEYLNDTLIGTAFFEGNIKKDKIEFLLEGKAGEAYLKSAIEHKELNSLAQLWVKGIVIDWNIFYNERPSKVQLPPYQFNEKRFWIESMPESKKTEKSLHPLVHQNISDLSAQKFSSTFNGTEKFLEDHKVQGIKMLPGVAYLELARVGGSFSLGKDVTTIRNMVWLSPIKHTGSNVSVVTSYQIQGDGVGFEISSGEADGKVVHGQGILSSSEVTPSQKRSLSSIQNRMIGKASGIACYSKFLEHGFNYGPSFQGIQELHYSPTEALSRIVVEQNSDYTLPPNLMDSALQTCLGLTFDQENQALELPFSIRELIHHNELPSEVWCHVQKKPTSSKLSEYDLEILSNTGEVLVQINDFVALDVNSNNQKKELAKPELVYYSNDWEGIPLSETESITSEHQHFILVDVPSNVNETITNQANWTVDELSSPTPIELFEHIKQVIVQHIKPKTPLNITLLGNSENVKDFGFIRGLFKSAQQEFRQISGKVIGLDIDQLRDIQSQIDLLQKELQSEDDHVNYVSRQRYVRTLKTIEAPISINESEIKKGGVYLITGGTGGLGVAFAKHLSHTSDTTIILSGRSQLNTERKALVSKMPNVHYQQCDVNDLDSVMQLIESIKKDHGQINGILHAAGVLRDGLLLNKTKVETLEVFAPKIDGIIHLDQATKSEQLDFLFCFSSVAAVLGNSGQSDYSAANAYMDDYIAYRNELVAKGERKGHTQSINWPLWQSGGMQVDESIEKHIEKHWGMKTLPSDLGLAEFTHCLQTKLSTYGVLYGSREELDNKFFNSKSKKSKVAKNQSVVSNQELEEAVTIIVSKVLKLDIEDIDVDLELGDFGFDSISLTQFSNALNEEFDLDLVPTVFYSYSTVGELSSFMASDYPDQVGKKFQGVSEMNTSNEGNSLEDDIPQMSQEKIVGNRFYQDEKISVSVKDEIKPIDVAIVGISGRLPGSSNLDEFWNSIEQMKDLITEVPKDRWDWEAYYGDSLRERKKTKAKHGGFISDMDKFDALFFNISPHEAELMDPQQRIALEEVYHLFENAGIQPESLKGSDTGVFVGVSGTDYAILLNRYADVVDEAHFSTGYSHAVLANRISYLFDLHGPSEPIDTACSSSLVAIHRAVENIRLGNCKMAVAGGVNAILAPDLTLSFSQAGMLSPDGRCKTFDKDANGYVRAEGVGFVLLKSLEEAKKDGDHIYGLIRGSNENHGGRANTLTSPNPKAQKDLLVKSYTKSGINPLDINYIEAHGTGTPLGDPIETEALKAAFSELFTAENVEPKEAYCKLGSVKSNIGHLESAAGIAGVLKVILAMKYKKLPGNPQLRTSNPYLKLENSPFQLLTKTENWKIDEGKSRIAGVSSFGFGGANAHIILEEYKPEASILNANAPVVICLSAKNSDRLNSIKYELHTFLESNPETDLISLAYTLQIGRDEMDYRWATKVDSVQELIEVLKQDAHEQSKLTNQGEIEKKPETYLTQENQTTDQLLASADLVKIGQLWVKGVCFDWRKLYNESHPVKIQLPVYPFYRNRHWFEKPTESNPVKELESVEERISPSKEKLHPLLHNYKAI